MDSPHMQLSPLAGPLYAARFGWGLEPLLAAGGHSQAVLVWRIEADCPCVGSIAGHANAVLDLAWTGDGRVCTAGADQAAMLFDV
jgi:hypothetical protein